LCLAQPRLHWPASTGAAFDAKKSSRQVLKSSQPSSSCAILNENGYLKHRIPLKLRAVPTENRERLYVEHTLRPAPLVADTSGHGQTSG
jgi:hypothetical protein